jgi:hypothetical protein
LNHVVPRLKQNQINQTWWQGPVIPTLGRLRQEDGKFNTSLGYIGKLSQKQKQSEKPKK